MAILLDWVKQQVSGTPGTGAITLGSAVSGFIRFQDDTRLTNGATVYYTIEDGSNRERGVATYSSTGPTLTRTAIHAKLESGTYSENPGTGLNLTTSAVVSCSAVAQPSNFRGCLLKHTAGQSIPASVSTSVSWNLEEYDTSGFHNNTTNNSRITIPSGMGISKVQMSATFALPLVLDNYFSIKLRKNGADFVGTPVVTSINPISNSTVILNITSPVIAVSDADYFEVSIIHTKSSAIVTTTTAETYGYFSLEVIE